MIEITIFKGCLHIRVSELNVKTKVELLDACSIKNCTAKMDSYNIIEVRGTHSNLYNLLVELTLSYLVLLK